LFKKWEELHEFQEVGTPINDFSFEKIIEFIKNNDFIPKDLEHNSVGNILSAYFRSRGALEEEEKRINAEKELERIKKEEEEKKKKELEALQEEEAKKESEKKTQRKQPQEKKPRLKKHRLNSKNYPVPK
jgi:thiamine pyrophosphate-dependent acetolactate synthase large subunit-like protein